MNRGTPGLPVHLAQGNSLGQLQSFGLQSREGSKQEDSPLHGEWEVSNADFPVQWYMELDKVQFFFNVVLSQWCMNVISEVEWDQ